MLDTPLEVFGAGENGSGREVNHLLRFGIVDEGLKEASDRCGVDEAIEEGQGFCNVGMH